MLRSVLGVVVALLLFTGAAAADIVSLEEAVSEKVLGNADAPVTILEYSSLGCGHCANFHRDTLPRIKKEYIETGKVKLILRDFPLGAPAMAAAMLARCAGNDRYFPMVEMLFRGQRAWAFTRDPASALRQTACMANQKLLEALTNAKNKAVAERKIDSTPTFFIGETRIPGAQPFEVFKQAIDAALAEAGIK